MSDDNLTVMGHSGGPVLPPASYPALETFKGNKDTRPVLRLHMNIGHCFDIWTDYVDEGQFTGPVFRVREHKPSGVWEGLASTIYFLEGLHLRFFPDGGDKVIMEDLDRIGESLLREEGERHSRQASMDKRHKNPKGDTK